MVKLFILALVLIAGGAIVGMTTSYNPILLIMAGFVCGGIAAVKDVDAMPPLSMPERAGAQFPQAGPKAPSITDAGQMP